MLLATTVLFFYFCWHERIQSAFGHVRQCFFIVTSGFSQTFNVMVMQSNSMFLDRMFLTSILVGL